MKIQLTPAFLSQIKFAQGRELSLEDLHVKIDDDNQPILVYSKSGDPVPPDPTHPRP